MNPGIDVDEHSICGQSLGAVRCDGIAMVQMSHLVGIERDLSAAVEMNAGAAFRRERFNGRLLSIGDSQVLHRSGELHPVSNCQLDRDGLVGVHAFET